MALSRPHLAHADPPFDHGKTAFPLSGKHQKVACESCHPAAGATRKWAGVPTDCHGCHGDRANHKGVLGAQCKQCHDVGGWTAIKHTRAQHQFALVGKHDLECKSCHATGAHLAPKQVCADCHAQPHGGTTAICTTCHNLVDWKAAAFAGHTFTAEQLPGKHRTATCIGCHPGFQFAGTTVQCESCHRKDQPHEAIGTCESCHGNRGLTWTTVTLKHSTAAQPPSRYQVVPKFDHVVHGEKVVASRLASQCATCHPKLDFSKRPAMEACETCHNGKNPRGQHAPFDALGTQCSRCHKPLATPSIERAAVAPAVPKFSHTQHAALKVEIGNCGGCHGAGVDWQQVRAGRDQHQPCQTCHAPEFRKSNQAICLVCHAGNDAFAPNPLRPPQPIGTEWHRGPVPHEIHRSAQVACTTCHAAQGPATAAATTAPPPVTGHAMCGQCHTTGAKLTIEQCAGCHVLATMAPEAAPARPWSTRAQFRHDDAHRGQPCEGCHRDVAPGGSAMTSPTMGDCASCHDGAKAFKTTGFECARCHARGR